MKKELKPVRRPSCNELLYMDLQDFTNSYAIQLVFKVSRIENLPRIEEAVHTVLAANPGINVSYRGGKYYPVTEPVRIRTLTIEQEDLFEHPFFHEKIDYRSHSVEISLIHHSSGEYFIVKIMHSVLDGQAALIFIQNIANVLNDKPLIPSVDEMDDYTFVRQREHYSKPEPKLPRITILDTKPVSHSHLRWRTLEIDGYTNAIIARISRVIADLSPDGCGRIMIPADIRRYDPGVNYNTNLTLPLFLNITKDETVGEIYGDLLGQMRDKKELNLANTTYFHYKKLPEFIRKGMLRFLISTVRRRNKFSVSGLISLLGKVNLEDYNNPCITFENLISLPDHPALISMSMVITQYRKKTYISLTYFEGQFSEEKMDEISGKIVEALSPDIYPFNRNNTVKQPDVFETILKNLQTLGDAVAVIDDTEHSYSELARAAGRIAGYLKNLKLRDACLRMKRGFAYLATVLACIYEGIPYIPIDLSRTDSEADKIRSLSDSGKMLTDADIEKLLSEEEDKRYELSYMPNPDKEVYRIFTSGTTGEPKCVSILRKNLNNYLAWAAGELIKETVVNMPLFTSLSVDLTVTNTFLPFLCGGFVRTFEENYNAGVLLRILSDNRLNVVKCTPTHLAFLSDKMIAELPKCETPKTFLLGGEKLSTLLTGKLFDIFGRDTIVYNEYGPTETTVGVSVKRVLPDDKQQESHVSIGTPIDNTRILLVSDGKIVRKENEIGEIVISGDSIFKGYRNQNADCFWKDGEDVYYRSGDLGFVREGLLYCIGREDGQVKINGNRVELEDIRSHINKTEGISDSVLIYDGALYAFLVGSKDAEERVRESLMRNLPSYMMPKKFIFIPEIPLGRSGKTDLEALRRKIASDLSAKEEQSKRDFGGDRLLEILHEYVDDGTISKDENLYLSGMESLQFLLFLQKVKEEFIGSGREDAFYNAVLERADGLTVADIEKLIVQYGGKR